MLQGLRIIGSSEKLPFGIPPILYKYREFDNPFHKKIIEDNCVYFAAPNTFPDTKDCHPKEIFPSEAVVRTRFWERSFRDYPCMSFEQREQYVQNLVSTAPILDIETRDALIESIFADYCKCHGVLSVTANPSNDKMWQEYAKGHTGFCVGFDSYKLATVSGAGGPVTYCDELPEIRIWVDSQESEYEKRVFNKERKWDYEQEYRLCKTWPIEVIENGVDRNVFLPEGCIVSVICGCNMKPKDVDEMRRLLARCQPQAKLTIES